jgi:CheY-like chemotaxis protein
MSTLSRALLEGWYVLIVDDDMQSLDVARRILKFYGADVYTANNGLEALDIMQHVHPKFVVSDIEMPIMDGWEMVQRLKNNRETMNIPVIALTAYAMVGDREKAIAAGFHNYLSKPLNPATFMSELVSLLEDIPGLNFSLEDN